MTVLQGPGLVHQSRRSAIAAAVGLAAVAMGRRASASAGAIPPAPSAGADVVAGDESYWSDVRAAFDRNPDLVQLWHGPGGAVPRALICTANALATGEARDMGLLPEYDALEESGSSQALRTRLGATFGCGSDEIALTRNAMEGLLTALTGVDLKRGDEVVSTEYDYDSCLAILRQREAREGINLRLARIPAPARDAQSVVDALEAEVTPRTRLMLVCHMLTHTGQVLPIREIAAWRDGATSFSLSTARTGPVIFR